MNSLVLVLISILVLVLLIAKFKVNAFLSLLLVSLGLAMSLGNTGAEAVAMVTQGFGSTMAACGIIIVLGVIIGYFLEKTGGAEKIAASVLRVTGQKKATLAMCVTGSLVSIPVFADSGFLILFPIIKNLSRKAKVSFMAICLGTVVCLALTHATIPPTPGPIAAAGILGADLGKVILYGFLISISATAMICFYATRVIAKKYPAYATETVEMTAEAEEAMAGQNTKGYSTFKAYLPIVVPIILIIIQSVAGNALPAEHILNRIFSFIGTPVIALLIGVAIVWVITKDYKVSERLTWLEKAMDSTAMVILITCAGGAFGAVIKSSDIGSVISSTLSHLPLPAIILPWLISAAIVSATGSTTVAMTTAAGVCAPLLPALGISPELCVAAIAAGGMCVLHVNSSMFWLVQRMCNFEVKDILKTIVPLSFFCSIAALAMTFVISLFA